MAVVIILYAWLVFDGKAIPVQKPVSPITRDSLGYKQNNPGDIRNQGDQFDGEIKSYNSFKAFYNMAYGYRAIAILFFNYFNGGANTIRKIISKYAPPSENNTANYVYQVSKQSGIGSDRILTLKDFKPGLFSEANFKKIVRAVSNEEISYVNEKELAQGYNQFLKDRL